MNTLLLLLLLAPQDTVQAAPVTSEIRCPWVLDTPLTFETQLIRLYDEYVQARNDDSTQVEVGGSNPLKYWRHGEPRGFEDFMQWLKEREK